MPELKNEHIEKLKELVIHKFGRNVLYPKDCTALANKISEISKRQVSETTLKRIWQLVQTKFNPSKYTLDSLAIYVGFDDWNNFLESEFKTGKNIKSSNLWNSIKKKADSVSDYSLMAIKNRMQNSYEKTIVRNFSLSWMSEFLNSGKSATALVAPGGYGKSTILTHAVEHFFTAPDAVFKDDIVWFIDCSIINKLVKQNFFNIDHFLLQLMGYDSHDSLRKYFLSNPEYLKGRLFLIIDGFNDISNNQNDINGFLDNLLKLVETNDHTPWFKLILSCRNNIWEYMVNKLTGYPILKQKWFLVNFAAGSDIYTNIPKLTNSEIVDILNLNGCHDFIQNLDTLDEALLEFIKIPFFINLYIQHALNETIISEVDLLNKYISKTVLPAGNVDYELGQAKLHFVFEFLRFTDYGKNPELVSYEQIKPLIAENQLAYNELLSYGIFFEHHVQQEYFKKNCYIKFSHDILFEYFITIYWLKNHNLNISLFATVGNFYNDNPNLKLHIFNWLIKFALKNKHAEIIEHIFDFLHQNCCCTAQSENCQILAAVIIGNHLRFDELLRSYVISSFAVNSNARKYYFEFFCDMDYLNKYFARELKIYEKGSAKSDDLLYAGSLEFLHYFYTLQHEKLNSQFAQIEKFYSPQTSVDVHILYLTCRMLYEKYCNNQITSVLLQQIDNLNFSELLLNKPKYNFSPLHFLNTLIICQLYNKAQTIVTQIETTIHNNKQRNILTMLKNKALLESNETPETSLSSIIENIENNHSFADVDKNFWLLNFYITESKFLIVNGQAGLAVILLKKSMEISEKLNYFYFTALANELLQKIKS